MPRRVLAVIPARYGSTRFPGKPLAPIAGTPMILHVCRRAAKVNGVDRLVVATDDKRIARVVEDDGWQAILTTKAHRTGTSRVAEIALVIKHGIVLNIQGDEPLLPVRGVERLIEVMRTNGSIQMATLAASSSDPRDYKDPHHVKVVCDTSGNALYFSRAPIPSAAEKYMQHIGIYAYRRMFLLRYQSLRRGPLEKLESLEQLRALENGYPVRIVSCHTVPAGVDCPEDIKRVEKMLKNG
jgi:3-deoxy-manno-octulosonate cytidylyltransferase (CMP-KDO synthetase)